MVQSRTRLDTDGPDLRPWASGPGGLSWNRQALNGVPVVVEWGGSVNDGGERRGWTPVLAPLLVVALLLVGCAATGHQGASSATGADAIPATSASTSLTSTPPAVELPPCADQTATDKMLLSTTPDGPAKGAVTGTAVSTSFSLANGAFTADPPPADYEPAVTAQQAGCQLAAAMGVRGFAAPPGRLALATVTIAPGLRFESSVAAGERFASAYPGPLPSYQHRVAWILISAADNNVSSCPTRGPSPSQAAAGQCRASAPVRGLRHRRHDRREPDHVRGPLRAVRGHVLVSRRRSLCRTRSCPCPWTIVSRAADGLSAQITASWSSCEVYTLTGTTYATSPSAASAAPPKPATSASPLHAWVERPHGGVGITVNRPFGPDCGPATAHSLTLHPAVVGATIPDPVTHDPLGLVASQVD